MTVNSQMASPRIESDGYRHAIGAALILAGLPLAWYARVWFGRDDDRLFSVVLMSIGLVAATQWERLLKGRFHVSPLMVLAPLLVLGPAILIASFFARPNDISALYLGFVGVFFLAILTSPVTAFTNLPRAFFAVTLVVATLALGQYLLVGPALFDDGEFGSRLFAGDSNNPNYLAFVAGLGLVAAFSGGEVFSTTVLRQCLWLLGVPVLAIVFLLCGTRSALLGFAFCLGFVLLQRFLGPRRGFNPSRIAKRRLPRWQVIAFALIWIPLGAASVVALGDQLMDAAEVFASRTVAAFDVSIAGGAKESDESAETRAALRDQVSTEFSVWGNGYDALYVDAPVLQAFYDFGIIGGLAFAGVVLAMPLSWAFFKVRSRRLLMEEKFPLLVYLFFLPNLLFHGRPYDFSVWLPVMLLFSVMARRDLLPQQDDPTLAVN